MERILVTVCCLVIINLGVKGQDIKKSVSGSGGDVTKNEQYRAGVTIGQPVAGIQLSTDARASLGFWYSGLDLVTSVKEVDFESDVVKFYLSQNHPNPFSIDTYFDLHLPIKTYVKMELYDQKGVLVDELVNEQLASGKYSIRWEASLLPSGNYIAIIRLEDGSSHTIYGVNKLSF